jgi:GTP-binding protein
LNKRDALDEAGRMAVREACAAVLPGAPIFEISAVTGEGTDALCYATAEALEAQRSAEEQDEAVREAQRALREAIDEDLLVQTAEARQRRAGKASDDNDEDEGSDVEVHYAR